MKLFVVAIACLVAAVCAEPEPYYGYYGHQLQWPGVRAPGVSATCYGCRPLHHLGKRSAEPFYYPYAYGPFIAHSLAAVPTAAGPTGVAGHPGAATSYTARSPQGLRGKREAEADAEPAYPFGFYGYPHAYGYGFPYRPAATSFVARSPQGLRGKRSAEPYYGYYGHPFAYRPYAYGPGIAGHPSGTSYVARSPQGLGK